MMGGRGLLPGLAGFAGRFTRAVRQAGWAALLLLGSIAPVAANSLDEYQVKAGFLFNFVAFTEWPADTGSAIDVCVYGPDPFGPALDRLHGRVSAGRTLAVKRVNSVAELGNCQVVFISRPVIDNLPRVLDALNGMPVLTVADSPGAMVQGVALNMGTRQGRVTIEANLAAARANRLNLSSKLLNLATEVKQ
ncbi:MAG: YfiR family protein [Thiobacillus sp.]